MMMERLERKGMMNLILAIHKHPGLSKNHYVTTCRGAGTRTTFNRIDELKKMELVRIEYNPKHNMDRLYLTDRGTRIAEHIAEIQKNMCFVGWGDS